MVNIYEVYYTTTQPTLNPSGYRRYRVYAKHKINAIKALHQMRKDQSYFSKVTKIEAVNYIRTIVP